MRARILAELDDIQDQSNASAVAKNISFLGSNVMEASLREEY